MIREEERERKVNIRDEGHIWSNLTRKCEKGVHFVQNCAARIKSDGWDNRITSIRNGWKRLSDEKIPFDNREGKLEK